MGFMEIGGWARQHTAGCRVLHRCTAQPSSAPAALGDCKQFLIKEGFPSNAQGRHVNKIKLPENLQD